jgi:phage tail-like protein
MNANGQRFWMLADATDWGRGDGTLAYDAERRLLTLARRRPQASFAADPAAAEAALSRLPHTVDDAGVRFWIEGDRLMVLGAGGSSAAQTLRTGLGAISDLAACQGAMLCLLEADGLRLIDLSGRWADIRLDDPAFTAFRLTPAPAGGAWLLDRARRRLARLTGSPRAPDPVVYAAATVRPCSDNPCPPRLVVLPDAVCTADATPVALACNRLGELAVLVWRADGGCELARYDARGERLPARSLIGLARAHALAWLDDTRLACLVAGATEAPTYDLANQAGPLEPQGDYYPLRRHAGGPFINALLPRAHFLATPNSGSTAPENLRLKPLARLSVPAHVAEGRAGNARPLDSGSPGHVWHRLYLEALIPDGCGVRVRLAASDSAAPPADDDDAGWCEHRFGALYDAAREPELAHGVWVPQPSELPHHPGLLPCPRESGRAGLFTALIQRPGRVVRALAGRYLHVRVILGGNGRASPAVAALRAWGARFSYVDRYLPELYREALTGPAKDQAGAATGADFLERMLGNFEGVLTALEDRIAHAHLLTDPAATPDDALAWLGRWIGLAFDPAWPPARRRDLLRMTPELYRAHGTRPGLERALDAATGGAVRGGGIVVLEDFRLRRLAATILGADLADEHDPLFDGLVASANSIVGDTLFLGDAERAELMALFAPAAGDAMLQSAASESAVLDFYDQLAHRASVLVQADIAPRTLGLVRRVADSMSPAHIAVRVHLVSAPLIVGLAALVGIDTRLQAKPEPPLARLDASAMGYARVARGLAYAAPAIAPIADAGPRRVVEQGASFVLSGERSRAGPGRRIAHYRWTWRE